MTQRIVGRGFNLDGTGRISGSLDSASPQDLTTKAELDAAIGSIPAAPVTSVFGRSGVVVVADGDYYGVVATAKTGATAASRYVGATISGAPVTGTFLKGDFVLAQDGHFFICTVAGTPGTWVDTGSTISYAMPAIVLGTAAADGVASSVIRSDSTILAFDATVPTTQAFGDVAATGAAAIAARRDHKHAMPATPVTSIAKTGASALTGAVTLTGGTGVTLTESGNDITIASTASGGGIGSTELVYRYTVTGSDKASIDTGVDTPDAGSNDWTNGDLLEVFLLARTDDVAATAALHINVNGDSSSIYDIQAFGVVNTTVTGANALAQTTWSVTTHGSGGSTGYAASYVLIFPDYAGTTFWKQGSLLIGLNDATAASDRSQSNAIGWRNTVEINRIAIAAVATAKLKIGTQLLVYKRIAS